MSVKWKVWVHVERIDEESDSYTEPIEPDEVGEFDTEEEAIEFAASLTGKEEMEEDRKGDPFREAGKEVQA